MSSGATSLYVWSDFRGAPVVVGKMTLVGDREVEFFYAQTYLLQSGALPLDPTHLPLADPATPATARTHRIGLLKDSLQGVVGDAAPDAWGRRVLLQLHPRSLKTPFDSLLRMTGHSAGSLLFSASPTACKPRPAPPPLSQLGAAAEGAEVVALGQPLDTVVRHLLEAGTSLGGMRPKIAVQDEDGSQWIAKFARHDDRADFPRLEVATLKLAAACGIAACDARFVSVGTRSIALIRRFDRPAIGGSLHYASAHGLWNRDRASELSAKEWMSYGGIADLARRLVPAIDVAPTLRELFRRMIFNVLTGNTDDHGKNHGFLMDAQGRWRLAPAFDLLPTLDGSKEYQALGVGPDGRERSLANALAGAARMGLREAEAKTLIAEVQESLARHWKGCMDAEGVSSADVTAAHGRWL